MSKIKDRQNKRFDQFRTFWKKNIAYKFWSFISRVIHRRAFFLDSNLIFRNLNQHNSYPTLSRKLLSQYFITDTIAEEISALEKNGLSKIFFCKYRILGFSSIRKKYPFVCPIYYTLISWMYNPANIASLEFPIHLIQSLKLRGRQLTKVQNNLYMKCMDRVKRGAESTINSDGKPKTALAKNMDISLSQYLKKKIKNRGSKNLLNDYKNVCLALLFTLLKKQNTTFITADRDLLAIVLTLTESIAQNSTFHFMILPTLSDLDKRNLLAGKMITRFLSFKEFQKKFERVLSDLLNPYWKKNHIYFSIKLWDEQNKSFIEELMINFDSIGQESILHTHGPLSCHFAKNDTHGNWLHYQFWPPPPPPSPDVVKIIVTAKKIINRRNIFVPDAIHKLNCKYAIDDSMDNLKKYYGFWV